jgi:hypothetical protein
MLVSASAQMMELSGIIKDGGLEERSKNRWMTCVRGYHEEEDCSHIGYRHTGFG